MTNLNKIIEFLSYIQRQDEQFKEELLKTTAATFCCECKKNKPTGLYPFFHRFGRTLCASCGNEYTEFLKKIGAQD